MKIAYLMSRFPKVTETFVLYEMAAMERLGAEVEIFPLLRHRRGPRHPEAETFVRRARFTPFLSLEVLAANLHFLRMDPGAYLRTWWDVLRGTWGSANFFIGALGILPKSALIAREVERLRVEHVHAHFANHPAVAALVVGRLARVPFSFTAHGSDLHVERRMLERKVEEAALVVTISEYNRDLIVAECGEGARAKVRVIHCGVDTTAFAPREGGARRERPLPFHLVCVASFEAVKGHRFLVRACELLRRQGVAFVCDLIGDGPERAAVEGAVRRAGLEERVRILGALPRPAVIEALSTADAAVLASRPTPSGKREGIPVALMEAMACGIPVVASAVSGIPELVEDGRTGLLARPGDPDDLARALRRLAEDPILARVLGQRGREKVLEDFDLERSATRLLGEIRKLSESTGGRTDRRVPRGTEGAPGPPCPSPRRKPGPGPAATGSPSIVTLSGESA